jgi:selenocysteine lyase/cysteine desulfurase
MAQQPANLFQTTMIMQAFRAKFPLLGRVTYINSCSYGALGVDVERALGEYVASRHAKGADWDCWIGKGFALKDKLGRLLGVSADDLSISGSATQSVNALASSFRLDGKRRKIVTTAFDFPTTAQIWRAQATQGAVVETAMATEDGLDIPLDRFERLIDDETLIVSVPAVCYWNGVRLPLEPLIALAHSRGALVLVDAYQAVGTFPIDCRALGADFVVGGFLKYLLGSAGVGFLYVRDSRSGAHDPRMTGWLAQADVDAMDVFSHRPADDARRFEGGTPSVPSLYACDAGLGSLLGLDQAAVAAQIGALTRSIKDRARAAGYALATPADDDRHGALVAIRSADAAQTVARLAAMDIVVSSRASNIRISPHCYNDENDIEALFRGLHSCRDLLA